MYRDPKTKVFHSHVHDPADPGSISSNVVWDLQEGPKKEILAATDNGLNILPADQQKSADPVFQSYRADPYNPFSLSSNFTITLFKDRSDLVWVGTTDGGVNKLDRSIQRFAAFLQSERGQPGPESQFHLVFVGRSIESPLGRHLQRIEPAQPEYR